MLPIVSSSTLASVAVNESEGAGTTNHSVVHPEEGKEEEEVEDEEEALTPHERRCRMELGPLVQALLHALQHPEPPRLAPAALPLPGSPARAPPAAAKKAETGTANAEAVASEAANSNESSSGSSSKDASATPTSDDAASSVAFVAVALRTGHRCCLCGAWGFKNWDDCLGHVRTVHEADAVTLTRRKDARASLRARCVAAAKDAAAALMAAEAKAAEAAAAARATALGDASGGAESAADGASAADSVGSDGGAEGGKTSGQERKRRQEQVAAGDAAKKAQTAAAQAAAAALAAEQLRPLEFTAHETVMAAFRALQRGVAALVQRQPQPPQSLSMNGHENAPNAGGQKKKEKKKDAPLLLSDLSPRLVHLCRNGRTVTLPSSSSAQSSAASAMARPKLSTAVSTSSSDPLRLVGSDECVTALRTKTRPKQVVFVSADGKQRPYLLKGCEDLHQDQRVMQLLVAANRLLAAQPATRARNLSAGHYAVSTHTMVIVHVTPKYLCCFEGRSFMIISRFFNLLPPFVISILFLSVVTIFHCPCVPSSTLRYPEQVVPLSSQAGLVEWVPRAVPLFQVVVRSVLCTLSSAPRNCDELVKHSFLCLCGHGLNHLHLCRCFLSCFILLSTSFFLHADLSALAAGGCSRPRSCRSGTRCLPAAAD